MVVWHGRRWDENWFIHLISQLNNDRKRIERIEIIDDLIYHLSQLTSHILPSNYSQSHPIESWERNISPQGRSQSPLYMRGKLWDKRWKNRIIKSTISSPPILPSSHLQLTIYHLPSSQNLKSSFIPFLWWEMIWERRLMVDGGWSWDSGWWDGEFCIIVLISSRGVIQVAAIKKMRRWDGGRLILSRVYLSSTMSINNHFINHLISNQLFLQLIQIRWGKWDEFDDHYLFDVGGW